MKHGIYSRRAVLKGLGGTAVGLPLLDVFSPPRAGAAGTGGDFALFMVGCNGVAQAYNNLEPDLFWPRTPGTLTRDGLAADLAAKRSTGELAEHAQRLLLIKGIKLPFRSSGDSHNSADCQILTAQQNISKPTPTAFGESIDQLASQGTNLNLLLNTLLGAVGVTKPDGSPVDDFGSSELPKGRVTEIIAGA